MNWNRFVATSTSISLSLLPEIQRKVWGFSSLVMADALNKSIRAWQWPGIKSPLICNYNQPDLQPSNSLGRWTNSASSKYQRQRIELKLWELTSIGKRESLQRLIKWMGKLFGFWGSSSSMLWHFCSIWILKFTLNPQNRFSAERTLGLMPAIFHLTW